MSSDEETSEIKMEWNFSAQDDSLSVAVYRNDAAAVRRALRNGADVNGVRAAPHITSTPLFEACHEGYSEIVRILLDAGADVRWKNKWGSSVLLEVCEKGDLSLVDMLINHDKDLLDFPDDNGLTPLSLAINNQHFDIVRFLLDRGANVHATTQDGYTALMYACYVGNIAIVRLLLAAGVDVEARSENQQTAMHYAFVSLSSETVRELILEHNANMFAVDQSGNTPFDLISHRTDNSVVDQFLDIYSDKMTQDHGPLALHFILVAAEYTFVEDDTFHPPLKPVLQIRLPLGKLTLKHFRTLLSTFDTNLIRNRDEIGKLPVHLACRNNAPVEVLSILVDIDAATLHIADDAGALALHECCCGVVNDSSVRFLVEHGGVGTLTARSREGALPLHQLCRSTNPSLRMVQFMVQSFPGSVIARTNAGRYPFVIAACESSTASLSVVYELVRANPDLVIRISSK